MNRSSPGASDRSTSRRRGVQLDLSLDGVPRGRQSSTLAATLRRRVLDGTLASGTHLPSSRRLAADLGVSRGVVVATYEQLTAEGHLTAGRGSGTSVAVRDAGGAAETRPPIEVPAVAGMNPGQPDPSLFPRRDWQRAMRRALDRLPDEALAYGDPRGHLPLRSALRGALGRTRSIHTDEDRIIVTSGFAQCLHLVVQLLSRRDGRAVIAVEDPGSAGAAAQLRWLGAEVVPVAVDGQGLVVDRLAPTAARAVVVTPAHQYPTGVSLAPERRHALVEWARRTDGLVVEDDYDAEYRYDRAPLTSLHPLGPGQVIAAGSVSKSLGPALRLGWMVAPDRLVVELATAKANTDLGTSVLAQAALADIIETGGLDRHLRRTRAVYRRRRDRLVEVLGSVDGVEVSGIAAGLHLVVTPPPGVDVGALVERARSAGFAAQPLSRYRHHPGPDGLVLGYAALPDHRVADAAGHLVELLVTA